ncbi:hypothetical protein A6R68_10498 [Neotoma lepida]|uniref:Uncharacterized protein n=1 Tax=Neotoma lepida TaxID=56216 RepID=A0A1A6FXP3_NEOLE|nr:hypothetical protein A6R68_10498 [Neotoma lepida]
MGNSSLGVPWGIWEDLSWKGFQSLQKQALGHHTEDSAGTEHLASRALVLVHSPAHTNPAEAPGPRKQGTQQALHLSPHCSNQSSQPPLPTSLGNLETGSDLPVPWGIQEGT